MLKYLVKIIYFPRLSQKQNTFLKKTKLEYV